MNGREKDEKWNDKREKRDVGRKTRKKRRRECVILKDWGGDESEKCVRMEDEKKHIEYLSANNVFDHDRISCTFHFHLLPFRPTFTYIITYNEFYVFPKCFGS